MGMSLNCDTVVKFFLLPIVGIFFQKQEIIPDEYC
jgi:hypothetical protein